MTLISLNIFLQLREKPLLEGRACQAVKTEADSTTWNSSRFFFKTIGA